jgi:hypothetical protein
LITTVLFVEKLPREGIMLVTTKGVTLGVAETEVEGVRVAEA